MHTTRSIRSLRLTHAMLVFICMLLCPFASLAQTDIIKIPDGVLTGSGAQMGKNSIAAQSKPIEKKAMFGGVERSWYEYIPASYKADKAVPLVVVVHGGNSNGARELNATAWAQIADQLGFIVICPNGSISTNNTGTNNTGANNSFRWNAYEKFNSSPDVAISSDNGVDEAKFFKELIEKTEKDYRIDVSRVYMHGHSNGGIMTSYFGLRYPSMLAAMAVASAPPSIEVMNSYPAPTKLPTYFWGGENDLLAGQYNPANKSRAAICKEFAEFWARINKTEQEPKLRLDGNYNTKVYTGDAEVRITEFRNGIHALPFTTAYILWNEFFSRFGRGKNGEVLHLIADNVQAAPADSGAVAIKLGAPFALVGNTLMRTSKTIDAMPVVAYGIPFNGVVVSADFAAAAFGGTATYKGNDILITTKTATVMFTVGSNKMMVNGKEVILRQSPRMMGSGVYSEVMIPLLPFVETALGKKLSSRQDVYHNDIYYASDRAADLSAQTITYLDQKLADRN